VNIVKMLTIALLGIVSVGVLLAGVVPAACLLLGLGIDIPNAWGHSGKILFFFSHPWIPLLVGLLLLIFFGWGIWTLMKG
jgi:hypothetical protein